jgi:hypothetical protein
MGDDRLRPARRRRFVDDGAGGGLLDPVVVASVTLLVVNDHLLKQAARGTAWSLVTGKLSDVAGMVFFPVLLVAAVELVQAWRGRFSSPSPRVASVVAVVVAVVFSATKTIVVAGVVYAWSLAVLQWPARCAWSWFNDRPWPTLAPVVHVVDPADVIAIVGVLFVIIQTRRRAQARVSA